METLEVINLPTRLAKTMFWDVEPIRDEFKTDAEFKEAHDAWSRRQIPPQPEEGEMWTEEHDQQVMFFERNHLRWKGCVPCIDGCTGHIDELNNRQVVVCFDDNIFSATIFRLVDEYTSEQIAHISTKQPITVEMYELFLKEHLVELEPYEREL